MKSSRGVSIGVPAAVLLALLLAGYLTRGAMQQMAAMRNGAGSSIVDQRPWQTAQSLAPRAVSAEEQALAKEAERLANQELDQAFAYALRRASLQVKSLSGEALAAQQRVIAVQKTLAEDKARVDALTVAAARSGTPSAEGDDLDVAKAQMGLDGDQLTDATGDLQRESGDERAKIQQELEARETAMKAFGSGVGEKGQIAVLSTRRYGTLAGRVKAWFAQRNRARLLAQAEAEARGAAAELVGNHDRLQAGAGSTASGLANLAGRIPAGTVAAGTVPAGTARARMLRGLAAQSAMMSLLDERVASETQLAAVYATWQQQVWTQHRIVDHLLLQSLALVAAIALLAALLDWLGSSLIERTMTRASKEAGGSKAGADRPRLHTLGTILHLAVQVLALAAILLVVFGVPSQTPTILGLATAGLTVVFQDWILAFFGWFILMGKDGIRVGDWVEINSVGGEVAAIGLFRTAVLETGNWTSQGHPTGRRVLFMNSFATRGQYFNFSTTGQWMWDEIQLTMPAETQSYALIEKMDAVVQGEMSESTEGAKREWQRATKANGLSQFDAKPTVDMRPAAAGVSVIVRYVTRASERYEVANRLNAKLLDLMQGAAPAQTLTP